jgi:ribosome biogenesis protein BMS1
MQKRAVVMEPEEKKALALLQQIQAISRDKESKRKGPALLSKEFLLLALLPFSPFLGVPV